MKSRIIFILFVSASLFAIDDFQLWEGNQIGNAWSNNGTITAGRPGMEWPLGSGNYVVYAGGLWIVSEKINGITDIRSAACEFTSEFVPGPWGSDPTAPENRIYKIRVADGAANPDWQVWPVDQGAPWIDVNENGVYDPAIDKPDTKGDLYFWSVFNDGNEERHSWLWSTSPLDIEVSSAIYGFEAPHPLENVMFIEWNIRNAGENQLDSVYLGIWQDIDLGDATKDYLGCKPDLDLSYHYKDELPDRDYGLFPPAVGFTLLQGPIVPSPGETAWVSGEAIPDHMNLHSSAFYPFNSSSEFGDPETAWEAFRHLQGQDIEGHLHINPVTGNPDPFIFNGNPLDGTGWLAANETNPRDWRSLLSTGPFSFSPGDSQQVVAACAISPGSDPLAAVAALFDDVETVHNIYDSQFTDLADIVQISEVDLPHNTESPGPFTFQFEILDTQSKWSNETKLHYQLDDLWYTVDLISQGSLIWSAEIPNLLVESTTTLSYYLSHEDTAGELDYWPSGAPYNTRLFTFGPDLEVPRVAGLQGHDDIHYLLPFVKSVQIDTVFDVRNNIAEVWLNWTVGTSDIMTGPVLPIDSNEVEWHSNTVYAGEMADMAMQVGDTIRYWVTAVDGSLNENMADSEHLFFVAGIEEYIGNWERKLRYTDFVDWHPFENGSFSTFYDGEKHWGNTVQLAMSTTTEATSDTMTFTRKLDLTYFEQCWLRIPMAFTFAEGTYGVLQVFTQGNWITIDQFSGVQPSGTYQYDLIPYTDEAEFSLRFLVHRPEGFVFWVIDDVLLHSDSNYLVGTNQISQLPQSFELQQNYPNPFNPTTIIPYALPEMEDVAITIYDLKGRMVRSWEIKNQTAGWYDLQWNGLDSRGALLATGVYFGHLQAGTFQQTIKMVLLR